MEEEKEGGSKGGHRDGERERERDDSQTDKGDRRSHLQDTGAVGQWNHSHVQQQDTAILTLKSTQSHVHRNTLKCQA